MEEKQKKGVGRIVAFLSQSSEKGPAKSTTGLVEYVHKPLDYPSILNMPLSNGHL
jgi:hypothetical protein